MRWMKYLASAGVAVLLGACVTNVAPPLKNDVAPSNTNGVIAGSFSRTKTVDMAFIVRNTKTGAEYTLSMGENSTLPKSVTQQVMAMEVPPGEYAILQWETFATITKERFGKYEVTNPYISAPFTVQAGQVTFLGDYQIVGTQVYSALHWTVSPQRISFDAARELFVSAYPTYANNAFTCRMCNETLQGNTTRVKDILQDTHSYLATQFSPSALTPGVAQAVTTVDNEPLHFERIVLHLTWHYNVDNPSKASTSNEVRTLINAGGPFVETMSESYRNGLPTGQIYELTYRNILSMKNQTLNLSQAFAPQPMEVKSFERFDSISSIASGAHFAYHYGSHSQTANFGASIASCVSEGREPASTLDPSLTGDGMRVVCDNYNVNNVLLNRIRTLYLPQYGVGVPLSVESGQGRNVANLTAVTVE
jgi:hypothetical protein